MLFAVQQDAAIPAATVYNLLAASLGCCILHCSGDLVMFVDGSSDTQLQRSTAAQE